jgi:hypothetical protein
MRDNFSGFRDYTTVTIEEENPERNQTSDEHASAKQGIDP